MVHRINRTSSDERRAALLRAARFMSLALVLLGLSFYGLARVRVVDRVVVQPYLATLAQVAGFGLRAGGFNNSVAGHQIQSDRFTAEVDRTCGALEVMSVFLAVTLAFPVTVRQRFSGVCIGLVLITLANIMRIGILFIVGSTSPSALDTAHYGYGQAFLLLIAMSVWVAWMLSATRKTSNGH